MCVDCELLEVITVGEELAMKVLKECGWCVLNYTDYEVAMCKMDRIVKKELGHD
jgi:hypothetical protein